MLVSNARFASKIVGLSRAELKAHHTIIVFEFPMQEKIEYDVTTRLFQLEAHVFTMEIRFYRYSRDGMTFV